MWGTTLWELMQPKVQISRSTTLPPKSARRSGPSALSHDSLVSSGAGPRSGSATAGEVDATIVSSTSFQDAARRLQGAPPAQPAPRIDRIARHTPGIDGCVNRIGWKSTRETLRRD